jgi:glycerol-3-phosphate acyltransferase PlsY
MFLRLFTACREDRKLKLFILSLIGAYTAGSINFPILLFKILGKDDPRKKFSGNPGAFNVYRQLGGLWAAVILLVDLSRAMGVAAISVKLLHSEFVPWAGLALILGNRFPVFHRFRGGKGVANYLGFTTIISPVASAVSAVAWVVTYALFRVPFIGSFVMVFTLGVATLFSVDFQPLAGIGTLATMALIIFAHRSNIRNLAQKRKREL